MNNFITASQMGLRLESFGDVANVIGAGFGQDGVLLTEQDLGAEFFVLKSGLAGELFQKATNYKISLAIVLSDFSAFGERFFELTNEHRRHNLIRFFGSLTDAENWLNSR